MRLSVVLFLFILQGCASAPMRMHRVPTIGEVLGPTNEGMGFKVVEVWAAYCPACEHAAPKLQALYEQFGNCAQFMALYVDESPETPQRLAKKLGLTYPIAPDAEEIFSRTFSVRELPTLLVFNAKNELVLKHAGLDPSFSQQLSELMSGYVSQSKGPNLETCSISSRSFLPK